RLRARLPAVLKWPPRLGQVGAAEPSDQWARFVGDDGGTGHPETAKLKRAAGEACAYGGRDLVGEAFGVFGEARGGERGIGGEGQGGEGVKEGGTAFRAPPRGRPLEVTGGERSSSCSVVRLGNRRFSSTAISGASDWRRPRPGGRALRAPCGRAPRHPSSAV